MLHVSGGGGGVSFRAPVAFCCLLLCRRGSCNFTLVEIVHCDSHNLTPVVVDVHSRALTLALLSAKCCLHMLEAWTFTLGRQEQPMNAEGKWYGFLPQATCHAAPLRLMLWHIFGGLSSRSAETHMTHVFGHY